MASACYSWSESAERFSFPRSWQQDTTLSDEVQAVGMDADDGGEGESGKDESH